MSAIVPSSFCHPLALLISEAEISRTGGVLREGKYFRLLWNYSRSIWQFSNEQGICYEKYGLNKAIFLVKMYITSS